MLRGPDHMARRSMTPIILGLEPPRGQGNPLDQLPIGSYHARLSRSVWEDRLPFVCWSEKMAERELDAAGDASLDQALGYLNFSSGTSDPLFLARINALFGRI